MVFLRIESGSVNLEAYGSYWQVRSREVSLRVWKGAGRAGGPSGAGAAGTVKRKSSRVLFELPAEDRFKVFLLQKMLEALTGKKIKFSFLARLVSEQEEEEQAGSGVAPAAVPAEAVQQGSPPAGWRLEITFREVRSEGEKLSFAARGRVKTADGREISFSVELQMKREFFEERFTRITAGDAAYTDPLVINFSGSPPELRGDYFFFDLDGDGQAEKIPFPAPGSGFLALDLDGDGLIASGKELFGPATGDGFAELSRYDEDKNSWLDENDPVFDRLRIWTKDEKGEDVLFALGQKGIGAIYLGSLKALFGMAGRDGQLLGQVRGLGVYLREDGSAGTLQEIDLLNLEV